jgi:uncharacterized protein YdaU (DUF1376 family)
MTDQDVSKSDSKSKTPWVRFFPSDWLAGTIGLTDAERGIYITLICMMYESPDGWIKDDRTRLRHYCSSTNRYFSRMVDNLIEQGKLIAVDGRLTNQRVQEERSKAAQMHRKVKNAARARWSKKPIKSKPPPVQKDMHSECMSDANQNQNHISHSLRSCDTRAKKPGTAPLDQDEFDAFWAICPNKVGKAAAAKAFKYARRRVDLDTLMAGWKRYINKTDDRLWCNPATWLNQDRWTDEPAARPPSARSPSGAKHPGQAALDELRRRQEIGQAEDTIPFGRLNIDAD